MSIEFTQFLLPNGRRTQVTLNRPKDIEVMAAKVIDAGYEFHTEILTTGEVSMTCFDPDDEVDIEIEVCANGPDVCAAADRLISASHRLVIPT